MHGSDVGPCFGESVELADRVHVHLAAVTSWDEIGNVKDVC